MARHRTLVLTRPEALRHNPALSSTSPSRRRTEPVITSDRRIRSTSLDLQPLRASPSNRDPSGDSRNSVCEENHQKRLQKGPSESRSDRGEPTVHIEQQLG
jgi:hypothetical protein